jgi:hypothetical protein
MDIRKSSLENGGRLQGQAILARDIRGQCSQLEAEKVKI